MASTYTFQNAYDIATVASSSTAITTAAQIGIADMVNKEIWKFLPWSFTSSNLTSISLSASVQDYTISNTDVYKLTKLWLTRTDTAPDQYKMLNLWQYLPPNLQVQQTFNGHRGIAYIKEGTNDRLRLEYSVNLPTDVTVQIDGEYQYNPTNVTALSSSIAYDDRHIDVVVNGLIYYIYRFTNDVRAGEMRIDRSGNRAYTGAFGTYMNSLQAMADTEDWADQPQFPDANFGDFRGTNPGLFGT